MRTPLLLGFRLRSCNLDGEDFLALVVESRLVYSQRGDGDGVDVVK